MMTTAELAPGIFATRLVMGIGPRGVEAVKVSGTTTAPAARSSPVMNSRLCSKAWDPAGLGPKLTTRSRSVKALPPVEVAGFRETGHVGHGLNVRSKSEGESYSGKESEGLRREFE